MEQLKENMMSEIKKVFDEYLEEADEEACNYLIFDDLDKFEEFYDDFAMEYFNRENHTPIDQDTFMDKYYFCWFDAFKIIKEFYEEMDATFDDYDDEQKSWDAFCYVCARESTFLEFDKYKFWFKTPKQKFVNDCNSRIEDINACVSIKISPSLKNCSKFEKQTRLKYYQNLKVLDIDNAEKNLQVINLILQKEMKKYEKGKECIYIEVCNDCKKSYNYLLKFKERAIELKG
jgi:hypothetical protein